VTKLRRAARRAAGGTGVPLAVLTGLAVLMLASCTGGGIAASTPLSNGTSYVSGSYSSVYYAPGSRPLAPKVTGTTLTGAKWSLASERGKLVVLNFWGSWCAPCRREAPALAALAAHFKTTQVRFVGDDVHDSPATAKAFEQQFNVGYPSLNDPGEQVALAFHGTVPPVGIPTTLLIDRTGRVAGRIVGGVSYDGLRSLISKILAEKA
jgi:thiol-disulfide isomerase/thioredoxin